MWEDTSDHLERFVGDTRGVPSVVGTLFMVAIVVILAALIGKFVFGLDIVQGGQQAVAPQMSYDTEFTESANELTIDHTGGDVVEASTLEVVGTQSGTLLSSSDIDSQVGPEWEEGETLTVSGVQSSETVRIVWQSSRTGDTSTIIKWNG